MKEIDCYLCPDCGGEVPVGSASCPGCGPRKVAQRMRQKKRRKKKRSWEQDSAQDGLDLPSNDYDYEDFVEREFGSKPHRKIGITWYWWLTAIVVLAIFTFILISAW